MTRHSAAGAGRLPRARRLPGPLHTECKDRRRLTPAVRAPAGGAAAGRRASAAGPSPRRCQPARGRPRGAAPAPCWRPSAHGGPTGAGARSTASRRRSPGSPPASSPSSSPPRHARRDSTGTLRRDRLAMRGRLIALDLAPPGAPGTAVCVTREHELQQRPRRARRRPPPRLPRHARTHRTWMGGEPMAAAALTGRLPLPRRRPASRAASSEQLAFHRTGGPLVAVCGLAGGAGTSTLAYLLARRAARHSTVPVLLAELDPARPGSSPWPGPPRRSGSASSPAPSTRSVRRSGPSPSAGGAPAGRLHRAGRSAPASHRARSSGCSTTPAPRTAWSSSTPASPPRARQSSCWRWPTTCCSACPRPPPASAAPSCSWPAVCYAALAPRAHRALVCAATQQGARAQVRQLRRLADGRVDRLLLVPHLPQLARGELDQPAFEPTLTALATILRRRA